MTTGSAFLDALAADHRAALLERARRRRFAKGQAIFHEGDEGNALFVIERGHVAVQLSTADGHEVIVTVLGPGSTFGELALLDDRRTRNASAIALDAVEVLRIERRDFDELCSVDAAVVAVLLGQLVESVQRSTTLYAEALHLPADRRVKRRLVELAGLYADPTGRKPPVVRLTHDDLARIAGTSRQTVSETVGELVAEGVVRSERGRLHIEDLAALRRMARGV
jgi:CRP/FNR family cyclic AMP-dependent transcriptional regulator